jgi:hypothetical protein
MRRLRLLEAVMSALDVGKPGASSAASQAAALLDGLHTLLGSLAADATPPGESASTPRQPALARLKLRQQDTCSPNLIAY